MFLVRGGQRAASGSSRGGLVAVTDHRLLFVGGWVVPRTGDLAFENVVSVDTEASGVPGVPTRISFTTSGGRAGLHLAVKPNERAMTVASHIRARTGR